MDEKRYYYNGQTIIRMHHGRYSIPGLPWGDQPGEYPSFRKLENAKGFIDRINEERCSDKHAYRNTWRA